MAGKSPKSVEDALLARKRHKSPRPEKPQLFPVEGNSGQRRKFRPLIAVALLLAALALALHGSSAWTAYQNRQLAGMPLPELESLVRAQPDNMQARYRLGLAYAHADRLREASQEFLTVIEKEPTRADVLNDLGVTYLLQERYYECLVALEGALTLKPDSATTHANIGRLHLATKMPFTAVRDLEKAVQLDPKRIDALCDLGEAYQRTLNYKSAESVYQRALRLDNHSVAAHMGLGRTYHSLAQYDRAELELNTALALAPEDPGGLLALGRMRLDRATSPEDLHAVQELCKRALKVDELNPEAWYDLGRVALRLGKPADAVSYQKRALQLSPQHMSALHQMERALRAAKRTAEADRVARVFKERSLRDREETHLEEVISRNPQDWDSQARLAQLYLLSGKRGTAMLIVRRMQDGAPTHPRLPGLLQTLSRQNVVLQSAPPKGPDR
jgi:tetratricopeptide (TPR) repeat protein